MRVKCNGCTKKFEVSPEIFANYEIIFCPTCGLHHQIIKQPTYTTIKSLQYA